jgi:hypothetical protein
LPTNKAKSVVCALHTIQRLWQGAVVNTIYFLLAVAATSGVIFTLLMRADRINRRRGSSDGGSSAPSTDESSVASWFGPYGGGRSEW